MLYQTYCKNIDNKVDMFHEVNKNSYQSNIAAIEEEIKSNLVYLNKYISQENADLIKNPYDFRNKLSCLVKHSYSLISKLEPQSLQQEYILYLFLLAFKKRSIRNKFGNGERYVFYYFYIELCLHYSEDALNLLEQIPNYGSWLDINNIYSIVSEDILDFPYKNDDPDNKFCNDHELCIKSMIQYRIIQIWVETLREDELTYEQSDENLQVSLLAKWIPKEGSSLSKKYKLDKLIAKNYYPELWEKDYKKALKYYRKLISKLNKNIKTTEIYMCNRNFKSIDYDAVPSKCLNKYNNAWLDVYKNNKRKHPNDDDRNISRMNYLNFRSKEKHSDINLERCYQQNSLESIINNIINDLRLYGNCLYFREKNRNKYDDYEHNINVCLDMISNKESEMLKNAVFQIDTNSSDHYSVSKAISLLFLSLFQKKNKDDIQYIITFEEKPEFMYLNTNNFIYHLVKTYPYLENQEIINDRFYTSNKLSWIEKIQLILLLKSDLKTNIVSVLDLLSVYCISLKQNMPQYIFSLSGHDFKNSVLTDVSRNLNDSNVPFHYKKSRIDFNIQKYNHESAEFIKNFYQQNSMIVPQYIICDLSDRNIHHKTKILLPYIDIVDNFDKVTIDIIINKSKVIHDSWLKLKYILDLKDYNPISEMFKKSIPDKISIAGRKLKFN